MNKLEHKKYKDINGNPDNVTYEVLFYLRQNDNEIELYETLELCSPPSIPQKGEIVSFNFIVDEEENEIFRTDGYIDRYSIGSDESNTQFTSPDFEVEEVTTRYEKSVIDSHKRNTIITKKVILKPLS